MIRVIFLFIFLNACSLEYSKKNASVPDLKFSDNLSIEEFKIKLKEYSLNNKYPDIDN